MKICDVIKRVDMLYPNEYTEDEKLYWAYEVSAIIADSVKESFGRIKAEKTAKGEFVLPLQIAFEDVEKVIADGYEIAKTDLMGELDFEGADDAKDVYVIYKKRPERYKQMIMENESVSFEKRDDGTFGFEYVGNVDVGDTVIIEADGSEERYKISSIENGRIYVLGEKEGEGKCNVFILKNAETLCGAPFEDMYINYITAKILFNQGDVEGYNRNMEMFQYIFGNFAASYRKNAPQRRNKYKNWW